MKWALYAALAAFTLAAPAAAAEARADGLALLAALAGTWRPADAPDSPLRIRFSTTAGGSVVVEEWSRAGRPHSLTLYHRDGDMLLATHYCPQGNQPRLVSVSQEDERQLRFAFRDGTDIDAGESHLHALAFDISDPKRIVRSETYRQGGAEEPDRLVLVREQAAIP